MNKRRIMLEEDLWLLIDTLSQDIYKKLDDELYSTETARMLLVGRKELLDDFIEAMEECLIEEEEKEEVENNIL